MTQPRSFTAAELQKLREAYGRSQEQWAALIGTTQVTISRWETAKAKPSPVFRMKLEKLSNYVIAKKKEEAGE